MFGAVECAGLVMVGSGESLPRVVGFVGSVAIGGMADLVSILSCFGPSFDGWFLIGVSISCFGSSLGGALATGVSISCFGSSSGGNLAAGASTAGLFEAGCGSSIFGGDDSGRPSSRFVAGVVGVEAALGADGLGAAGSVALSGSGVGLGAFDPGKGSSLSPGRTSLCAPSGIGEAIGFAGRSSALVTIGSMGEISAGAVIPSGEIRGCGFFSAGIGIWAGGSGWSFTGFSVGFVLDFVAGEFVFSGTDGLAGRGCVTAGWMSSERGGTAGPLAGDGLVFGGLAGVVRSGLGVPMPAGSGGPLGVVSGPGISWDFGGPGSVPTGLGSCGAGSVLDMTEAGGLGFSDGSGDGGSPGVPISGNSVPELGVTDGWVATAVVAGSASGFSSTAGKGRSEDDSGGPPRSDAGWFVSGPAVLGAVAGVVGAGAGAGAAGVSASGETNAGSVSGGGAVVLTACGGIDAIGTAATAGDSLVAGRFGAASATVVGVSGDGPLGSFCFGSVGSFVFSTESGVLVEPACARAGFSGRGAGSFSPSGLAVGSSAFVDSMEDLLAIEAGGVDLLGRVRAVALRTPTDRSTTSTVRGCW